MAVTLNNSAVYPVAAPFNTTPPYSGTFIPTVWSAKMNAKFYAASIFGEIANTDWQGEVSGMGDKVIINTAPTIAVSNYTVGGGVTYAVPTPNTQEMVIDKGKYFAFQINDVLDYQAKPALLDMFSTDAAEQMRVAIDSNVLYHTVMGADAANRGATAGVKSASYNLGTDASPIVLTASNVLQKILEMASVMDEQNLPAEGRWLALDPLTRTLLLQSNLSQAQITGDQTSPVRNGKVGKIDRFDIYVTNQLPRGNAGTATPWISGDGSETSIASTGAVAKRRVIAAGHRSGITFASQITKMETVRNPNDFGDFIRSLNVYGFKVVKPDSLVTMIAG